MLHWRNKQVPLPYITGKTLVQQQFPILVLGAVLVFSSFLLPTLYPPFMRPFSRHVSRIVHVFLLLFLSLSFATPAFFLLTIDGRRRTRLWGFNVVNSNNSLF